MIFTVTPEDLEEITILTIRAILESDDVPLEEKDQIITDISEHIESSVSNDEHIFLKYLNSEQEMLGFILLRNAWNLSNLYVIPNNQGEGVGKALFKEARNQAKTKENLGHIRVNSSPSAEGFYRSLGFESFIPSQPIPDYMIPLIYRLDNN